MSDESEPPALSLRPRKKPDEEASGAGEDANAKKETPKLSLKPKAPTETPAADTAAEKPRLSLKPKSKPTEPAAPEPPAAPAEPPTQPRAKPKLSIKPDPEPQPEPAAAAPEPAPEPETAPAPDAPPVVHRDETNPAIDPAVKEALKQAKSKKPKLKLTVSKEPEPTEAAPPAEAAAPPEPSSLPQQSSGFVGDGTPSASPAEAPADPNLPPPLPVVTDAENGAATTPPLPPPQQLEEDEEDDDESEAPARKRLRPEQRPIFKIAVFVIGILLLGGLAGGGYVVYNMFFASPELNPYAAPLQAVTETVTPPPPPPAETGPASVAGQLIEKAQDAVAAHDEVVDAADEASGAAEADDTETAATADTIAVETPAAPAEPEIAEPSLYFQDWVNNVVISGVAETSSPRAFINGVLVKQGDIVDHGLGIVFDGIDADENLVIFKDDTGAVVGKRY